MVKEPTLSPSLEKHTQVNTKMANPTEKAPTLGQMESSTKVTSKKESNMAKVFGENRRVCQTVTSMTVIIKMIPSMDTVSTDGPVETFIRDNILKMSVMVKEK